jgi:hypothetical protein
MNENRRKKPDRARWLAAAISLGLHLGVPLLLLFSSPGPVTLPVPPFRPPIQISLVEPPPAPPPVEAPAEPAEDPAAPRPSGDARPAPNRPTPPRTTPLALRPPRPAPANIPPVPIAASPAPPVAMASLSAGQLTGAAVAGSGNGSGPGSGGGEGDGTGSGGACDMIRRLQDALRDDPDIRATVAQAHRTLTADSRALLVWNGDWIQNPGQEGKGLAGLRQAIAAEVAFAPRACRTQSVRGIVLITLADGAGAPKVALGTGAWRWSDLTGAR